MNKSFQKFGAWCGFIAANVFFAGLVVADFLPSLPPGLTPDQLAEIYKAHQYGILFGGLLIVISAGFCGPFIAAIFMQLRRMEGTRPMGAYAQLAAGIGNIQFFILPGLFFVIAAYRPDRPPEILSALNDMLWIIALLPWTLNAMQCFSIGWTIIAHGTATTPYPRWVGFFNIWITVLMATSSVIPFFKTGPFAWNGLIGFWVPACVFGIWMTVMWWMTLKAIKTDDGKAFDAA
jgi:hypothetical protein